MAAPVRVPVGIALAERKLEAADRDRVDLLQYATDESPTCGKAIAHELRMRIMEPIEQHLEEVGRMVQVLDVNRDHREPALGMVAQVIHDAGLAGSPGRGEHHVPGAQRLPQLRDEILAEPQVNRVDGSPGVELGSTCHFHFDYVVKQNGCVELFHDNAGVCQPCRGVGRRPYAAPYRSTDDPLGPEAVLHAAVRPRGPGLFLPLSAFKLARRPGRGGDATNWDARRDSGLPGAGLAGQALELPRRQDQAPARRARSARHVGLSRGRRAPAGR